MVEQSRMNWVWKMLSELSRKVETAGKTTGCLVEKYFSKVLNLSQVAEMEGQVISM